MTMVWKHSILALVAIGAPFITTGCSSITLLRIKELKAVESRVDSLKSQLALQQETMLKELRNQNELLRLIRADQQVRFEELGQKIISLDGSLSESKYRLSQIDQKTQEIRDQWKAKTTADSNAAQQKTSQIDKLYQIAYSDFAAGRYDLAAMGFIDFVKQFPDVPLADEATYYIAECRYGKKEYDNAEVAYSDYIRKFRQGQKICAALYKLGLIFENKKKLEKRKMVWQKLLASCPTSDEAAVVKDRLGK